MDFLVETKKNEKGCSYLYGNRCISQTALNVFTDAINSKQKKIEKKTKGRLMSANSRLSFKEVILRFLFTG